MSNTGIWKKVNAARKALMHRITRNLGTTRFTGDVTVASKDSIRRILVCRPNHRLGNLLLITPLLQEITATIPEAKIDLFVKGHIAPQLFKNYPNVNRLIAVPRKPAKNLLQYVKGWIAIRRIRYDIVINVVNDSSSGRLSVQFANARYKFLGDLEGSFNGTANDHQHIAKKPVYSFRSNISKLGFKSVSGPVPLLDLRLTGEEIEKGTELLDALVSSERPTIGLYTYATGAKLYDVRWWEDFYLRLTTRYPGYNVIEILPVENVSQIDKKAPAFYSRDLREIGSLIANLALFIGADSGMMHLASAAHAPVVGLFKADNMNTYLPYNVGSIGVNTLHTDKEGLLASIDTLLQRQRENSTGRVRLEPTASPVKPAF